VRPIGSDPKPPVGCRPVADIEGNGAMLAYTVYLTEATSMQTVKIRVTDKRNQDERLVETRLVQVEMDRRLTGAIARRVLQREFPELGPVVTVVPFEDGWNAQQALRPAGNCDYHFVWRHYSLSPA
jgi:hypothetical protein